MRNINIRDGTKFVVALVMAIVTVFVLSGCVKSMAAETSQTQQTVHPSQQNKFLTAKLYVVMTFSFSNKEITWPTSLEIPSVPIYWMSGGILNGRSELTGPGQDVTDEVHGSVTGLDMDKFNVFFSPGY